MILMVLALLVLGALVWLYLEYRSEKRMASDPQENQQYYCYGHGFTYEPLQEYVFYEGRTRTHARLCAHCAKHRQAIPARASLQQSRY